ncbi:MAG: DNA gyrase C-terminal beta-propeller domain-containing protein, partial [Acidimicrobiia bacterium]
NHILDLPLGRLTELGQKELNDELKALLKTIKELTALLKSSSKVKELIVTDLNEFVNTLDAKRKTKIEKADSGDLETTALVAEEDLVINVSARKYIKAVQMSSKASKIASTKDRDSISNVYELTSLQSILVITNLGRAYRIPCFDLPKDRLSAVSSMVSLTSGEKPIAVLDIENVSSIAMITNLGGIKKVEADALKEIATRKDGVVCAKLSSNEKLVSAIEVHDDPDHQLLIVSKNGIGIRFQLDSLRCVSRSAGTVRAMKLKADDEVVSAVSVYEDDDCIITTDAAYAKRLHVNAMTLQSRGGSGMKAMRIAPSRGEVVDVCIALGDQTCFLTETSSKEINTTDIALQDREGSGTKIKGIEGAVLAISPIVDVV